MNAERIDSNPRRGRGWSRWLAIAGVASMLSMVAAAIWLRGIRQEVQCRVDVLSWGGEVAVRPSGPAWLGRLLDPRYAEEVIRVLLINTNVSAEELKRLQVFDALEELVLYQSAIGDESMQHVAKLRNLRRLNLYRTEVSEAGLVQLRELPRLEEIWIGPQASNRELEALAGIPTLKSINVNGAPEIDERGLEALKKLPSLQAVRISGASISPAALDSFRRELPDVILQVTDL